MRKFVFGYAFALSLTLTMAPAARAQAQEEPMPEEDKATQWQMAFDAGIEALNQKHFDESIRAFEVCIRLFADRPLPYYNIACAHSRAKRVAPAIDYLKKSFDRGFLDLGHVSRDSDLDNIRKETKFLNLIEATKTKILDKRPKTPTAKPEKTDGKAPLVVFVHRNGDDVSQASLAKTFESVVGAGCVVIAPTGRAGSAGNWDGTAETCIVADIEAALADEDLNVDPKKVVIVGELEGATLAWKVAVEHGYKRIVAAAGIYEKPEDATKLSGIRAWLVAPRPYEAALEGSAETRDDLLKAGSHVYVERHDEKSAFDKDTKEAIARAVAWVLDERAPAPDSGDVKRF